MPRHSCPNCGDQLPELLAITKMVDCDSCGTTVVLDGPMLRQAGTRGDMLDIPALVHLGQDFHANRQTYTPVGHLRFSYGPGWWDEFWCLTPDGSGVWLSVDEGDYALERPLQRSRWPVVMGKTTTFDGTSYEMSETDTATCIAFRGQLPEVAQLGEPHRYTNFVSAEGDALSRETWTENGTEAEAWFAGEWLDPWDIAPVK